MSAITETEPGQEMVCILSFEVRPQDGPDQQKQGEYRRFSVGEHVRYLGQFFVDRPEDNPVGYMAIFQPIDKRDDHKYEATQSYFVGMDCWEDLKNYFANNFVVTIGERKSKSVYRLNNVTRIKSKFQ